MEKMLYGTGKIAEFLGLESHVIRRAQRRGDLPAFKLGGTLCARPSDLRAWIDRKIKEGA